MLFIGRGHPAIRATHAKTLELTTDAEITGRATCVIAVGVAAPDTPLAGPIRITVTAGEETFSLTARANSAWDPAGPAVIRRSPLRRPDTFATQASAAASDLPRALADALRDPDTRVEVRAEPMPGPPCVVLCALDPDRGGDRQLIAEFSAADLIVAEDEDAARAVGERVGPGPVPVDGRVLVLASRELPGASVVTSLASVEIETIGLPPRLAAAAASPSRGPLLLAPDGADPRDLLRVTPPGTRLVVATTAQRLPALLHLAGDVGAVIVQENVSPRRVAPGQSPELPSQDPVHICFDAADESAALEPRVRVAIDALIADGVATKTVAKALAALTGWERRRAYAAVLAWPD
jgi:hypothetical protein